MSNRTSSHNACYASPSVSIPLGFNMPKNRIDIRIFAYSDVTTIDINLYEYHGLYWYSFSVDSGKVLNSVGFFSLQNCVAALRGTVRGLGFVLENSDCLSRFVNAWCRSERKKVA